MSKKSPSSNNNLIYTDQPQGGTFYTHTRHVQQVETDTCEL